MSRLNMRIDDELKEAASELYQALGMDLTTAVTVFLKQSVREGGLPFQPSLGNDDALKKEDHTPMPITAEASSGVMKIHFANDVIRYLKIASEGSTKIQLNPLAHIPQAVPIDEKGTMTLPGGHQITAKEAWEQGTLSMNIRINPFGGM